MKNRKHTTIDFMIITAVLAGACCTLKALRKPSVVHDRENGLHPAVPAADQHSSKTSIKTPARPPVLILVNHDVVIYNFRMELAERLLADGYEVHISSPAGEHTEELTSSGVHFHEITIDRHGMNPKDELCILREYQRLVSMIHPIAVLAYTVKPNIYGGIVARIFHVPFLANITGLGITVHGGGAREAFVLALYKFGLRGARRVFFQNEADRYFMVNRSVVPGPYTVLPGSGVNLEVHCFEPYPDDTGGLIFTTVGRIMKDKGTDELLDAAKTVRQHYPNVKFRLIGFFDDDYKTAVYKAVEEGAVEYIGQQKDIHPWMKESHAVIQPSYHEGMSNVLLEAAATGRPVLASDIPGCREAFDEGVSGLGFHVQDSRDLVRAIEEFISLSYRQKADMGKAGRKKMEKEFDRQTVVGEYMKEIYKITEENNLWNEGKTCAV